LTDRSTIARISRPAAARLVQPDAVRIIPRGQGLASSAAAAEPDVSRLAQIAPATAILPATFTHPTKRALPTTQL
jgi:hypothetical protein